MTGGGTGSAGWDRAAAEVLGEVTGGSVRDFATRDFGRQRDDGARSAIVGAARDEQALAEVRQRLPPGLVAFLGTSRWLGDEQPEPSDGVELVVAPDPDGDALAPLDVAATNAGDLGLDTAALRDRLRTLVDHGLDVVRAETDRLAFRLERPPGDPSDVVELIAGLAPDLAGDADARAALGREITAGETIDLWWD